VVLEVIFLASGQMKVTRVVSGLGFGMDDEAIHAAQRIRFTPAMRDGSPSIFPPASASSSASCSRNESRVTIEVQLEKKTTANSTAQVLRNANLKATRKPRCFAATCSRCCLSRRERPQASGRPSSSDRLEYHGSGWIPD